MGAAKKLIDGLWRSLFDVIEATGQSPIPVDEWPWFVTHAFRLNQRFNGIRQAAAYDHEGMTAPKEMWLDDKRLKAWFDERSEARQRDAGRNTT